MVQRIISQIENPLELEKLYRSDRVAFKSAFFEVFKNNPTEPILTYWQARFLLDEKSVATPITNWKTVIWIGLLIGFLLQLPKWFDWNEDLYYPKFTALLIFGGLSFLFLKWKQANPKQIGVIATCLIGAFGYLQVVQLQVSEQLMMLMELHLSLLLAFLFGFAYLGNQFNSSTERIGLVKFLGDTLIMSGLLLIGFFLFTALTLGLFNSIHLNANYYYGKYVVVWLLAPIPVVASALVFTNNQIVSKISPLVAKIFSPLAFISLLTFLLTYFAMGAGNFRDREFLLLFNAILMAVLALIFFSVANQTLKAKSFQLIILFLLSLVAIAINFVALFAVLERISMFGLSANKLAVLGSNGLILVHLLLTSFQLGKSVFSEVPTEGVQHKIVLFLPVYGVWLALVCLLFPFIF